MRKQNVLAALLLVIPSFVLAHGGEDHSHDKTNSAAPTSGEHPMRQPDGSVYVPKSLQRLYGLRTTIVQNETVPQTLQLQGQVVPDPNASGQVQATQNGRIVAGPNGLPVLGKPVRAGEILAYVEPVITSLERATQLAQLAEWDGQLEIARKRYERLRQLSGSVPQREIDEAQSEVSTLEKRHAALTSGLEEREPLRAPVNGVISRTQLVVGAIVEARESLVEIIDPQRLHVLALAFDPALATRVQTSSGLVGNQPITLDFLGAGYRLQEQAIPLQFLIKNPAPPLAVGQSIQVLVQITHQDSGVPVARSAVVKHSSGGSMVWVHTAAETFVPRLVQVQALDGNRVVIPQGIKPGERIVTTSSTLLSQIR